MTERMPPRWRSDRCRPRQVQRLLILVVSIAVAVALTACGAGRNLLGTSTGPCFIALPVARHAVSDRGLLTGIRRVDPATFTANNDPALHRLLDMLPVAPGHDVCLVAYTGSFTSGQVHRPVGSPGTSPVRYAIVVVTTEHPRLLGTFLVGHEPLNFSHPHVGF